MEVNVEVSWSLWGCFVSLTAVVMLDPRDSLVRGSGRAGRRPLSFFSAGSAAPVRPIWAHWNALNEFDLCSLPVANNSESPLSLEKTHHSESLFSATGSGSPWGCQTVWCVKQMQLADRKRELAWPWAVLHGRGPVEFGSHRMKLRSSDLTCWSLSFQVICSENLLSKELFCKTEIELSFHWVFYSLEFWVFEILFKLEYILQYMNSQKSFIFFSNNTCFSLKINIC